jgi:hypothetical protein
MEPTIALLRPLAAALAAACLPAAAATSEVSPTGFLVTIREETSATPHQVYAALGHVEQWWNGSHTWSGSAANLSLATEAGACFCERWGRNSVQHARVVYAAEDSVLRLDGALGPLQALAVNGVLTFGLAEKDGHTVVQATYRVAGSGGLDALAGAVDGVIGEQVKRLVSFASTGKPG